MLNHLFYTIFFQIIQSKNYYVSTMWSILYGKYNCKKMYANEIMENKLSNCPRLFSKYFLKIAISGQLVPILYVDLVIPTIKWSIWSSEINNYGSL